MEEKNKIYLGVGAGVVAVAILGYYFYKKGQAVTSASVPTGGTGTPANNTGGSVTNPTSIPDGTPITIHPSGEVVSDGVTVGFVPPNTVTSPTAAVVSKPSRFGALVNMSVPISSVPTVGGFRAASDQAQKDIIFGGVRDTADQAARFTTTTTVNKTTRF